MTSLKTRIGRLLPRRMKSDLKRLYERVVIRPKLDPESMLTLGTFGGLEIAYRRSSADEKVIAHNFSQDSFFANVPEYQPGESDVVIDVGAHIGMFSLLAGRKSPRGRVYAIEACRDTFNLLRINIALNRSENISAHHLALTDKEGQATLFYDVGNWGHTVVKGLTTSSENVASSSLAGFMERNRIDRCQFIKFNCEGAEFPILLNTPRTVLQRFRMMLVLYHCDLWAHNTGTDLMRHLEAAGFDCALRNETDLRGWIVAVNTAPAAVVQPRSAA